MPEPGFHTVRTHVRRNPRPGGKKTSPWVIGAVIVVGLWIVAHFGGTASGSVSSPPKPSSSVSAPAATGH